MKVNETCSYLFSDAEAGEEDWNIDHLDYQHCVEECCISAGECQAKTKKMARTAEWDQLLTIGSAEKGILLKLLENLVQICKLYPWKNGLKRARP